MSSLRKPMPFYIRAMDTNGTGVPLNSDNWTDIALDRLPMRMQRPDSIGVLDSIELLITAFATTRANDVALPSYLLHWLIDWQLQGPDGVTWVDRKGYQDPLREYLQHGRFVGQQCADLPATGGGGPGAYTRTFTKRISFTERRMGDKGARWVPVTYFRAGKLRIFTHLAQQVLAGVGLGATRFTITAVFNIRDVPADRMPIPAFIKETFKLGDNAQKPTPEPGRFLRCSLVNPITTAGGFTDDLASITKIDFGAPVGNDSAGMLHTDVDVSELLRRFNDEQSQDPRIMSTLTNPQELLRFLDPLQVASGKAHLIPLVAPHKGDTLLHAPAWSSKPELKINNDNRAGTPATVDWLIDRWEPRPPELTAQILESMKPGLSRRYQPQTTNLYKGMPTTMAPLVVDAR